MRRRGASFAKRTLLAPPVPEPVTNFKEAKSLREQAEELAPTKRKTSKTAESA